MSKILERYFPHKNFHKRIFASFLKPIVGKYFEKFIYLPEKIERYICGGFILWPKHSPSRRKNYTYFLCLPEELDTDRQRIGVQVGEQERKEEAPPAPLPHLRAHQMKVGT
jgi:hypothetical protein